jgi:hypothetical protein
MAPSLCVGQRLKTIGSDWLLRRSSAGPSSRGRLLCTELAVAPLELAACGLDGAGDGNELALSAWEVSAPASAVVRHSGHGDHLDRL